MKTYSLKGFDIYSYNLGGYSFKKALKFFGMYLGDLLIIWIYILFMFIVELMKDIMEDRIVI